MIYIFKKLVPDLLFKPKHFFYNHYPKKNYQKNTSLSYYFSSLSQMANTSFFIFSLLSIFVFVFAFPGFVSAQNEDVELILEEFEGGYIIVNWEDTIVYANETQHEEQLESEENGSANVTDVELVLEEAEGGLVVVNWEDTMTYGPHTEELILEEAEEGYVIVNWEDTLVHGKEDSEEKESSNEKESKITKTVKASEKVVRKFRGAKKSN